MVDENGRRILILQVKIHYHQYNNKKKNYILNVFNLFSVPVIARYSELSTLNFQDSENFGEFSGLMRFY